MRAMWSGSLSFGLVNIPVKLYSATKEQALDFDMLHKTDLSPIRYAKFCRHEEQEVENEEIVKGYEYKKGEYVVVTDEDFERASPRKTRSIEIVSFADQDEIDSVLYDKPYYLEPDRGADKAYALLREALRKSGKVGIARFVIRSRERIGAVKAEGDVLVLDQLRFSTEVRKPEGLNLPESEQATGKELDMAVMLVEKLSDKFVPDEFQDTYTQELLNLIESKAEGRVVAPTAEAPKPTKVIDLMDVLKASLEEATAKAS